MRKKLTDGRVVVSRHSAGAPSAARVKLTRFLKGARLPFAPTRSQPVTTAEAKLMPQVKRDRDFLSGEAVGEPAPMLTVLAAMTEVQSVGEVAMGVREAKEWSE